MRSFALASLILVAVILSSAPAPTRVGPLPGGGFLLNSGWRLQPAGSHVPLDTFPISSVRSGKYLVALNAGYNPPSLSVVDTEMLQEVSHMPIPDGWLGLASSGDKLYVGGAARAAVLEYSFRDGRLSRLRTFTFVPKEKRTPRDFIGDVALSPDGTRVYAADLFHNVIFVIDLGTGEVVSKFETGHRPYRIRFTPDGRSLYVSSWSGSSIYKHAAADGKMIGRAQTGPHPTDIAVSGSRVFVSCANTNQVDVFDEQLELVEHINVSLTPRQPVGMTPSALAIRDGKLHVVCSDANSVAVADISKNESKLLGFIPTGWYPTAIDAFPDGRLAILSARGVRSLPNPNAPNSLRSEAVVHAGDPDREYIARLHTGAAHFVPQFDSKQLAAYTRTVMAGCPYRDSKLTDAGVPSGNPVPNRPGAFSPIKHVLYIIKENRTYDQVLGDLKIGNGDASLAVFGEEITPNQHKLAREFVLFDNFYVNAEVSADGHNWSTAAIAPDYVQKMWGTSYGQRRRTHDYYGPGDEAANAPGGYIWNRVVSAGLRLRNYGYHVNNVRRPGSDGVQVASVGDPVLEKFTDPYFRGFDLDFPEYQRAKVFLADLARFEQQGELPRFMIMHLGRNHTAGTAPGRISPLSMVADNDYAVGLIVEALSKSRFWNDTAIFILEDDAQNGPDHIDSHRSPVFVISPYTKRSFVDSTMYNTASVLRTMELILGVAPLTHFDAGAPAMSNAFQHRPNTAAYEAEQPRISLELRNPQHSATAERSKRLNFDEPDEIEDDELNEILWLAIRGMNPPAPVRSFFSR